MKTGISVFLKSSPECRGTVSHVEGDRFQVTWNPYAVDRPDVLDKSSGVNLREAMKRTRSWYSKAETMNIGIGVPS